MVVLGKSHSRAHAGVGNAADQLPHASEDEQSKQAEVKYLILCCIPGLQLVELPPNIGCIEPGVVHIQERAVCLSIHATACLYYYYTISSS